MFCDTHTHSIHSFDGSEQIADMCRAAIAKGLSVLTITDHAEAMEGVPYSAFERERIAKQKADIDAARAEFGDRLTILFGCELGQPHLNPAYAKEILAEYTFDFVIGSLHFFCGNVDLYDVTYTPENVDARILQYFSETMEMIETGGFHSLGHLDYIMRRLEACYDGIPTYCGYEEQITRILEMLVERDMALEINTSGLRKWLSCIGLEDWVLRRFRELGGRYVTVGSDAHCKEDIGAGLSEAWELLRKAGFSNFVYYQNGKPIEAAISHTSSQTMR